MLYNNGYIVKELINNEDLLINDDIYRGLQSYHNWPLEKEEDNISKELSQLASTLFESHLEQYGYEYEIITDIELLKKYVNHCKKLQIEIIVMKIMSNKNAPVANNDLNEIEVLGYDCLATENYSYLAEAYAENNDYELLKNIKGKPNSNGLLNTCEEVEDFIEKRKELIKNGMNLEDYWDAIPVRISLVEI